MSAPAELKIDRRHFIGGSDAAAILGVSPWATRLDVFLEKTGQRAAVVDPARERLFRRGKRLEPVVIDMLIEENAVKVTKRSTPAQPNRYVDPEHSFLAAEIDFEWEVTPEIAAEFSLPEDLVGTIQNGEVKTVHPFASAKFGDAETDEIPVEYAAQAAHGLMVAGRSVTMFAVMVGADNLSLYFIYRDEDTIKGMRAKEVEFWMKHVIPEIAPRPVNLPDVLNLFGRVPAIRIEASEEVVKLVNELLNLRGEQRAAAQGEEEVKFQIGEYMLGKDAIVLNAKGEAKPSPTPKGGPHELTVKGVPVLAVGLQVQRRLDGDKVKADHPEVAAQCMKSLSFYKFAQPKKGKNK